MDPIILLFLSGLSVGTFAGLLLIGIRKDVFPETRTLPLLKFKQAPKTSHRRSSSRQSRQKRRFTGSRALKPKLKKSKTVPEPAQTLVKEVGIEASFDTCPSCGLQAPGVLMTEHFLGSPSHKDGARTRKIVEQEKVEKVAKLVVDSDPQSSVRSLLQMLVPPRAFGRRHQQKMQSPVSSIVSQLGPTRRIP